MVPNSGLRRDSQGRGGNCRLGNYPRGRDGPRLFVRSVRFPPPVRLPKRPSDESVDRRNAVVWKLCPHGRPLGKRSSLGHRDSTDQIKTDSRLHVNTSWPYLRPLLRLPGAGIDLPHSAVTDYISTADCRSPFEPGISEVW